MPLGPSIVTLLTLLVYFVVTINVGKARFKYKVQPPATTGDPNFERAFRVQQNTLEQLVFFLPLLWLFSYHVSQLWGTILGLIWVLGRVFYAYGYYKEASKRMLGFGISSLINLGLFIGTLIALSYSGFQQFS